MSDLAQHASVRSDCSVETLAVSVELKANDSIEVEELRPGVRSEDGGSGAPRAAPQEQWF